jgi:hypothetical protein
MRLRGPLARGGEIRLEPRGGGLQPVGGGRLRLVAPILPEPKLRLSVRNGQRSDRDEGATWEIVTEHFSPDSRETIAVANVRDEYGHLNHITELAASLLEGAVQGRSDNERCSARDHRGWAGCVAGRNFGSGPPSL